MSKQAEMEERFRSERHAEAESHERRYAELRVRGPAGLLPGAPLLLSGHWFTKDPAVVPWRGRISRNTQQMEGEPRTGRAVLFLNRS